MNFSQTLTDFVDALAAAKAAIPAVESFLIQTEGAAVADFENTETATVKKYQTMLADPRVVQVMITLKALELEFLSGIKPGASVPAPEPSHDVETDVNGLREAAKTPAMDENHGGNLDHDSEATDNNINENEVYQGDVIHGNNDETHVETPSDMISANNEEAESTVAKANKKAK